MQRRTRLIASAVAAATAALSLLPSPATAAPKPAQLHSFTPGGQLSSSEQFTPPGATPVVGDFDEKEGQDIVWYTPGAGGDSFWSSNEDGTWTASPLSINGTYTPYTGYFGGSTKGEDILWYSTTGASQLWDYTEPEDGSLIKTSLPNVTGSGTILVGDFTSDEVDDVVRYRPGASVEAWWDFDEQTMSTVPVITSRSFSVTGTYSPVVGSFRPGGNDYGEDILWYAPGTAADSLWDFNPDGTTTSSSLTINGTFTPVVERWLPNQADDVLWYAPGSAGDSLWDFRPDGSIQKQSLAINGTYTPYTCACIDSGLGDREEILWHGVGNAPDNLWSLQGDTFAPTSHSYPGGSIRGSKLVLPWLGGSYDQAVIAYG